MDTNINNEALTLLANDRAEHFARGFLGGLPRDTAELIKNTAFSALAYDNDSLQQIKYENSLLPVAAYLMSAKEMVGRAIQAGLW